MSDLTKDLEKAVEEAKLLAAGEIPPAASYQYKGDNLAHYVEGGRTVSLTEHGREMYSAEQITELLQENFDWGEKMAARRIAEFVRQFGGKPTTYATHESQMRHD